MLSISLIIQQLDPLTFAPFALRCVENYNDEVIKVMECIKRKPRQQTVTQQQLNDSIESMTSNTYAAVVESLKETLINTPVSQWKELIESTATVANVTDAESIQVFLDELQQRYGELKYLKEDITKSEDERFGLILDACDIKPNNKQFALSQFGIGNSYNAPRQLWVVPSGQGKSRAMIGMIMIYLISGAGTKVHVVFTSEHLMKRDKAEAADILLFIDDADTRVEYHVGIDFEPEAGSMVLIDEADTYMLDDPEKFRQFTSANVCIGLTATPAMTNMETAVQELLNFKQFSYNMGNGTVDTYEKIAVDSVIDAPDIKTLGEDEMQLQQWLQTSN